MSNCEVGFAMGISAVLVPVVLGIIAAVFIHRSEALERREMWGWRPSMDENGNPLSE